MFQTPDKSGILNDFSEIIENLGKKKILSIVGTDLMAGLVSKPVGSMGADIVYGNG